MLFSLPPLFQSQGFSIEVVGLSGVVIVLTEEGCILIEDMEFSFNNVTILNHQPEAVITMPTISIKGESRVDLTRVSMKSPHVTCVGVYSSNSHLLMNNCAVADSLAIIHAMQGSQVFSCCF